MASLQSKIIKARMQAGASKRSPVTKATLAARRKRFASSAKFFPVGRSTIIEPHKGSEFRGEWIRTPHSSPNKIMLYISGGGFVFDGTKVHRDLISRISDLSGVTAFSLNYSLAPEHPFPVALNETVAAYKWLLKKYDPSRIVLAGDSAGGSLVLSLLEIVGQKNLQIPAAAIVISPAADATLSSRLEGAEDPFISDGNLGFFIESYFQKTPHDDPVASPLFGSMKSFPPLLIHAAHGEIMYGDSLALYKKAKHANIKVRLYAPTGLWHVWHLFARYVPESRLAIADIADFIQENINSSR